MDTAPLKSFATWARRELITQVGARLTAVLAPSSPQRVENPRAVAALERDIADSGDGARGKDAIINKVAYTWFNRIVALRFMDANGYTGVGIVSPAHGQEAGQPEVLADAKRGSIDPDVVSSTRTQDAIMALLDGTRPSPDGQGEAYTLLLAEYCRYWHRFMPFIFESEGDYTELLIPPNLLASDSIVAKATAVLTAQVCRDVEVIGWLYQFYISERKDEVFAGFKKGHKAGAHEIPAATQLFTPHWIVRYLVENSIGRLWMLNHPSSRLIEQMDYYIAPVDQETDFLTVTHPEELTLIDPACGSGHMLTYAFDLLYAIYEEEGYAPSEIPGLILTHNLYGTEIDPRAGALAAFALTMKAATKRKLFVKNPVEPNVCVLDPITFAADELSYLATDDGDRRAEGAFWNQFAQADTFGALIRPDAAMTARLAEHLATLDGQGDLLGADVVSRAQRVIHQAEYLSREYAVVVANPPYMGSKQMNSVLSQFMKDEYPTGKADLMTAFMLKAQALTKPAGIWGMINLPSWMSLKSFEELRHDLLRSQQIVSLVHLGRGIFGSDFGSVAFVIANLKDDGRRAVYRRLFEQHVDVRSVATIEALFLDSDYNRFEVAQSDFAAIPGSPIVYWLSEKMLKSFAAHVQLGEIADVKHGLSTGRNEAVVRQWWEVSMNTFTPSCTSVEGAYSSGKSWFPYNSGGEFRRWYGNVDKVLRYDEFGRCLMATFPGHRHDGRARYFQEGITWSKVSSGRPAFRKQPRGQVFDVAGNGFFPDDMDNINALLGLCNSTTVQAMLAALSPTLNFEAGQIKRLPVPAGARSDIGGRIAKLVKVAGDDWNEAEMSWEFARNPLVDCSGGVHGHVHPTDLHESGQRDQGVVLEVPGGLE